MKYKNKLLGLGVVTAAVSPVLAVVSCGNPGDSIDRGILNSYGSLATNVISTQRVFDANFTNGNRWSGADPIGAAMVLPLVRSKISGKDVPSFTDENGQTLEQGANFDIKADGTAPKINVGFSSTHDETLEFEGAESITIGATTYNDIKSIPNDLGNDTITFNIPSGVHYVDYKGNETGYELKGLDFLYGMIRTLYSSKELRQGGKVNGKTINGLPKFSNSDNNLLVENDGNGMSAINNGNTYLYDLFNIDIQATINANISSANDRQFIMKFTSANDAKKTALTGFCANNSGLSPQSSDRIKELASEWANKTGNNLDNNPGIKYGISNYLSNKFDGINVSGYKQALSVSPYFYTKFDLLNSYVMKKNNHYVDSSWSSNPNTINKYVYHILPDGGDANARILQRVSNYKKGIETILDPTVFSSNQFQQFKENPEKSGYTYEKIYQTGIGNKLAWDVAVDPTTLLSGGNPAFNEKGLKMMYGNKATYANVKESFDSINEYFNGNGQILRGVLNNAINQYSIIREGTSTSNKEAIRSFLAPEQFLWDKSTTQGQMKNLPDSNQNHVFSRPTHSSTNEELENWYNTHSDINEVYKTPTTSYNYWKGELEKLANKVGATSSDKARVGVQFWEYRDKPPAPKQVAVINHIIDSLNQLSNKVEFVKVDAVNSNDFISGVQTKRSIQFHYVGWGPDYPLASSVYQGIFSSSSGASAIFGVIYHDFAQTGTTPYMPELKAEIQKESSDFPLINNQSNLKATMDKIGISTMRKWITGVDKDEIPAEQMAVLTELENAVVKPFYNISSNESATRNMAKYYSNHALGYTYNAYASGRGQVTKRIQGSAASEQVHKPWLTTAISSDGTAILMDYRVER